MSGGNGKAIALGGLALALVLFWGGKGAGSGKGPGTGTGTPPGGGTAPGGGTPPGTPVDRPSITIRVAGRNCFVGFGTPPQFGTTDQPAQPLPPEWAIAAADVGTIGAPDRRVAVWPRQGSQEVVELVLRGLRDKGIRPVIEDA